jgi:hypothetical protein
MKKKIQKPLKLSRETLISLGYDDLRKPMGALSQLPNCTSGCSGAACATASTCGVVNTQCVGW